MTKLVNKALAIQAEESREAGATGYMARALTQVTMLHSKPDTHEFTRTNSDFTLTMLAPSKIGRPYSSLPHLLMAWTTTETVLKKEPIHTTAWSRLASATANGAA